MMIAEEIIAGYVKIRDFLKDARNHYLKAKTRDYKLKSKSQYSSPVDRISCNAVTELNKRKNKIYSRYVNLYHSRLLKGSQA